LGEKPIKEGREMNITDEKWIDALGPYLGGGNVPYFTSPDGSVDAEKTMENFAKLHSFTKIGQNGESIPW
jgi:hypothetical protein